MIRSKYSRNFNTYNGLPYEYILRNLMEYINLSQSAKQKYISR